MNERMNGAIPLFPYIPSWHAQGYMYFAMAEVGL